MLKNRIIPCLDVKDGRVVKGVNFINLQDAGCPVKQAKTYEAQGADELCFLDINASYENRGTFYDIVAQVAEECFMPLTVGGGVRNLEDINKLLRQGADKVSINTSAVKNPDFVREASNKFGNQCIVVAIDAKSSTTTESGFEIFTHGGRKATGIDALKWAKRMEIYGAGEILLNSIDFDGTGNGFDVKLTSAIAKQVDIPIIASGGVGTIQDFKRGIEAGATGLLAASVFHFGKFKIGDVKKYLRQQKIAVRLP
jgi:cyclase